jgi:two-component system sensor histidine kinase GlrK
MRVSTRLTAGSALVLLLLLGALAYQLMQVRHLASISRELSRAGLRAARLSLSQIHDLDGLDQALRKYFVTRDPDYARLTRELGRQVSVRQQVLEGLPLSVEEREAVDSFGAAWRRLGEEVNPGPPAGPEADLLPRLARAQERARAVAEAAQGAVSAEASRAEASARRSQEISLLAGLLALLASVIVLWATIRSIRRPLERLADATHAVAGGRFDLQLPSRGRDEFGQLAEDFNVMVRRLSELDQMKKDILSHVSHELKTPLAALQETQQLLLEEIAGPLTGDQRRLLEMNLQSARRLSAMIAKLLDLARLEAGVMEYDLRPADFSQVAGSALSLMEVRAEEKGIVLRRELPKDSLWVRGDGDRLFQVVENLLENAVKFSPPGSAVEVAAAWAAQTPPGRGGELSGPASAGKAGWVLLTVSDHGPGVPDDQKARIFDRFHQVAPAGERAGGGVGLGLAICREIVSAHRGALWVEDNEGGGSRFRCLLPALEGGRPAAEGEGE